MDRKADRAADRQVNPDTDRQGATELRQVKGEKGKGGMKKKECDERKKKMKGEIDKGIINKEAE